MSIMLILNYQKTPPQVTVHPITRQQSWPPKLYQIAIYIIFNQQRLTYFNFQDIQQLPKLLSDPL
jgi:hypothetical protein